MFTVHTRVRDCTFLEATAALCLAQLTHSMEPEEAARAALAYAAALCTLLDRHHAAQEAQEDDEAGEDTLEDG